MKTNSRITCKVPYKGKKGIVLSSRSLGNYIKKISTLNKEPSVKKALIGTFAVLVWMAAIVAVSSTGMMLT